MIEPKQDYRAVIKSPDGDVAETTGPLMEVIRWAEKFVWFMSDGYELSVKQIQEGGDDGCIGIT